MSNLRAIHDRTIATYEEHASAWDEQRPTDFFEKAWIDRFIDSLPPRGRVLDVGCGAGRPIAGYLIDRGFRLTGIDAAAKMIDICRSRFTDGTWLVVDMRDLSLPQRYDGIVSWDAFFHLTPDEQRSTMRRFCRHLQPGGSLLLTIGHEAGEVLGMVNGTHVYHASLDPPEYEAILQAAGFAEISTTLSDERCGEHSVVLACGYSGPAGPDARRA